jgi:hypothetical protein
MGRIFTLSFVALLIAGQAGVLSQSLAQNGARDPSPAAYAVADGSYGKRVFIPRRSIAPPRCPPNRDAPGIYQLDPGLHYLGPCESAAANAG